MRLVVVGAGGHGKVVCDVLLSMGLAVDGFVDDGKPVGERVLGLPVLGNTAWLDDNASRIALGIGDNVRRRLLAERFVKTGSELVTGIHASATVAPSATIGPGAVVMAKAVVNPDARVDAGAIINTAVVVEHDCVVGAYAHLSPSSALGGTVTIGAEAHVGLGAVVLPGMTVGAGSVVGAGAVVNKTVPERVVVRGVPARIGRSL